MIDICKTCANSKWDEKCEIYRCKKHKCNINIPKDKINEHKCKDFKAVEGKKERSKW